MLFSILSRLVITFLPSSKRLLISWLQSLSAVILESPKINSLTVSSSICHEVMGQGAMIFKARDLEINPNVNTSRAVLKPTSPSELMILHISMYDFVDF